MIGIWNTVEKIDFSKLPESFVLKCNHNSGLGMCICKDKSKLDINKVKKELRLGLMQDYYITGREWPYKNVERKILCEKYMVDESGYELKDYKIFCFNGIPKLIEVDFDRFNGHKRNLYTNDWQFINAGIEFPSDINHIIEKPKKLNEMLSIAATLTKGFPHVRCDLYIINDHVYFGELTFYHGSGLEHFSPETLNYQMGEWIDLSHLAKYNLT